MKTVTLTPCSSSSVKSSTTVTAMEEHQAENADSCYYPGCRKDANCNCEICLASINATLDLMPFSVQKSSLTKLSTSRPKDVETTPISFDPSIVTTPRSSSFNIMDSPALKSTARLSVRASEKRKNEKGFGFQGVFLTLVLVLNLLLAVEFGFSWMVSGVLRPVLSPDIVRSVGERSCVVNDLNERLRFLTSELEGIVHSKVSNCSYNDSKWEINQDGLLLNSRCVLYKSATEEVSIWGWPLQTAGLLTAGFSSRSFSILSGRVTEWPNGDIGFSIRKVNTSWVQKKWGASVMQLDPNTWILEYRQSLILENSRLFSVTMELLKSCILSGIRRMNEKLCLFSSIWNQYRRFTAREHLQIPT
ncbi:uncharacterized protein LOC123210830 [Mangifera indica]|uniref:uncharacterized protein LOC123210830 n=1 Tax=Mangifera indica TaxID=29780 RepID=UPI001CFA1013|nr:uncharacterized protein LOC123210830 [Mangifera indica]